MTKATPDKTEHPRRRLEQEAAALDSDTTRALRLARENALEQIDGRGASWPLWLGSAAAGVLLFGVLAQLGDEVLPAAGGDPESVMADLEVLAQEDDLGLIEDLEFLDWLSRVDEENT